MSLDGWTAPANMTTFELWLSPWESGSSRLQEHALTPQIFLWFQHSAWQHLLYGSLLLLSWRLWRFTITPILYPSDPKEYPYWIPFLGHAIGFFFNSYRVLEKGRKHVDDGKPFSITIAGQTIYIVTSPEDVQSLYKNTSTVSWVRFVQDLYRWLGFSPIQIEKLWRVPTEQDKSLNPSRKLPPNGMIEKYEHCQLLPGENLDKLEKLFVEYLDTKLQWQQLQKEKYCLTNTSTAGIKVSLLDWTSDLFISAMTEIYWGKRIWDVAPNLLQSFLKWEETAWKYVFQLPRLLGKDMYTARDQIISAFTTYYGIPKDRRQDATFFVKIAEKELRDIAFDDHDVAKVNMLQHWAVNGNVHKVTFWILTYVAHDPILLKNIRNETRLGIVDNFPNVTYLVNQCPQLEAVFLEVLRLRMSSSLMRLITEPTEIGGRILRKGNSVMVPYRLLHFSEEAWSPKASQFDPQRFLNDKELAKNPSYRPFGGGQHLCPGRFLARKVVFTFVALVLKRFEVALDEVQTGDTERGSAEHTQRFPRPDESKPGLGTLSPMAGDEVMLHLRPRDNSGDEDWQ